VDVAGGWIGKTKDEVFCKKEKKTNEKTTMVDRVFLFLFLFLFLKKKVDGGF